MEGDLILASKTVPLSEVSPGVRFKFLKGAETYRRIEDERGRTAQSEVNEEHLLTFDLAAEVIQLPDRDPAFQPIWPPPPSRCSFAGA